MENSTRVRVKVSGFRNVVCVTICYGAIGHSLFFSCLFQKKIDLEFWLKVL